MAGREAGQAEQRQPPGRSTSAGSSRSRAHGAIDALGRVGHGDALAQAPPQLRLPAASAAATARAVRVAPAAHARTISGRCSA